LAQLRRLLLLLNGGDRTVLRIVMFRELNQDMFAVEVKENGEKLFDEKVLDSV
jgi:hypothetical protein